MKNGETGLKPEFLPVGDRACLIRWPDGLAAGLPWGMFKRLKEANFSWFVDAVPAETTLLVYYEPLLVAWEDLCRILASLPAAVSPGLGQRVVIPVVYGGDFGPDLLSVANRLGMDAQDVVRHHAQREYKVHFLGFIPGFAYMGDVDARIQLPRLDRPRAKVPSGSVAIAGRYTAVYPFDTPGGWQIIGWTPLTMFDPAREPRCLVQTGDRVVFLPIEPQELPSFSEGHSRGEV